MGLKSKISIYFVLVAGLPLVTAVLILYFYLVGGLRQIEFDNVTMTLGTIRTYLEKEGENLAQKVARAARADDYLLLQILLSKDKKGQIDQSRLISLTGEYQKLLKLDFLEVLSPEGMLLASGARPADFNRPTDFGFISQIVTEKSALGFATYKTGEKTTLCQLSGQILTYEDSVLAVIVGGNLVDNFYLQKVGLPYEVQVATLSGNVLLASTLAPEMEIQLNDELRKRNYSNFDQDYKLDKINFKPYFQQLYSLEKDQRFQIMLLHPPSYAQLLIIQGLKMYLIVAVAGIAIAGLLGYAFAHRLSAPIRELSRMAERVSRGEFDQKIFWFSNDELGTLVNGFNQMHERLKRSQQKLIQAEKLAAWNQMARKIAHEIKNPLTPIKISIEDLQRSFLKNEPDYPRILGNAAETIISEISKLNRIVDEFSAFAKLPTPDLQRIDAVALVKDSLRLYRTDQESGRIVIQSPEPTSGQVNADLGLFSQALINIVKNALEADPAGPVTVSISQSDNQILISVKDQGPGIPEEVKARIFTPYFTTKEGGNGLGLVIAQRIIFDHEGEIDFQSNKESGTIFTIKLPIAG